jgi:hypothetical protein
MELRDTIAPKRLTKLKHAPDRVDLLHAQSEIYAVKFPRAAFEAGMRVIARLVEKPEEADRVRFPRELPVVFMRNLAIEQRFVDETITYFDELAGKGARWIKPVALNHKGILMANTGRLEEAVKAYLDVLSADRSSTPPISISAGPRARHDFTRREGIASPTRVPSTDAIVTYGFGSSPRQSPTCRR